METPTRRRVAPGFTLIELLVVATIIAILAGLLLGAVSYAMKRARRSVATMETKGLELALEHYRLDFNVFPPDYVTAWTWDSGQCLVFHLGAVFRTGTAPALPWNTAVTGPTPDRTGGPYYEFPGDRLSGDGHFMDPWGYDPAEPLARLVYYYQFDNNEAEDGVGTFGNAATWWDPGDFTHDPTGINWNITNVHPQGVDIWSPGPNGIDAITFGGGAGGEPKLPAGQFHVTADSSVLEQYRRGCDDLGNW